MGCSGSKEAEKAVVVPPQQPYRPNPQDPSQQPIGGTRQPRTGGGGQDATAKGPASGNNDRVAKPASRPRIDNNTVDFQEFKDDEKNVVETMLESNKGLRMAEINFHDLKLSKIIGAGAFGEVIKGTYCGTPVVVKRMLRNKITEDNLRMFGEEIQLMMNLRHPNIVQVRTQVAVCLLMSAAVKPSCSTDLHHMNAAVVCLLPNSSSARVGTRTRTCTSSS